MRVFRCPPTQIDIGYGAADANGPIAASLATANTFVAANQEGYAFAGVMPVDPSIIEGLVLDAPGRHSAFNAPRP